MSATPSEASPTPSPASTSDDVISFDHVTRRFGENAAVDDVSLRVGHGELFGLVGPSGCGKTTLIRLIAGLLVPDEGDALVRGIEPAAFSARDRQDLGYMPQEFSLFPSLSIQQNCGFVAGLYGMGWFHRRRRIQNVLTFLDLWDARKRAAGSASGGMRRRLSLACALLHEPSLMLVDEPTAGLDPELRVRIWAHLREIQERGTTVVVTTQLIEEAERCDSVGIMRAGQMIAHGTPSALRESAGLAEIVEVEAEELDRADVGAIWSLSSVRNARLLSSTRLRVEVEDAEAVLAEVAATLHDRGRIVHRVDSHEASFEDVFLELVEVSRQ